MLGLIDKDKKTIKEFAKRLLKIANSDGVTDEDIRFCDKYSNYIKNDLQDRFSDVLLGHLMHYVGKYIKTGNRAILVNKVSYNGCLFTSFFSRPSFELIGTGYEYDEDSNVLKAGDDISIKIDNMNNSFMDYTTDKMVDVIIKRIKKVTKEITKEEYDETYIKLRNEYVKKMDTTMGL